MGLVGFMGVTGFMFCFKGLGLRWFMVFTGFFKGLGHIRFMGFIGFMGFLGFGAYGVFRLYRVYVVYRV